ncbi:hypothetical protein M0802_000260 [Mischocyttarus mexicanus]|nr:hypothetical protein M0802_000260 [Mischocyttarus mexicanus]
MRNIRFENFRHDVKTWNESGLQKMDVSEKGWCNLLVTRAEGNRSSDREKLHARNTITNEGWKNSKMSTKKNR